METQAKSRKWIVFGLKALFSFAMLVVIARKVFVREDAAGLWERLRDLSWPWFAVAVLMQLAAIGCSIVRWQRLLVGQGIHAPWRFLSSSFLMARFWGAFTPGGFTGLGGWRIYDIAVHTGKTARATAVIGVEMILGQMAFGAVVLVASIFGLRFLGWEGVFWVNAFFVALIGSALTLLSRPQLFRRLNALAPTGLRGRVRSLIESVCAYQGRGGLLAQATLWGVGTHAFNNLIYVSAAHALGVDLGPGEVFFASSLQIFATLLPASINGIGLREAAAVALYTRLGVPVTEALLIPVVGFAAEMLVSSFGGLVFALRRPGVRAVLRVEDEGREEAFLAEDQGAESLQSGPGLVWWRAASIGAGAGWLGGTLAGLAEAGVVVAAAQGQVGSRLFLFALLAYGLLGAGLGAAGLAFWALLSARLRFPSGSEGSLFGRTLAGLCVALLWGLGLFRLRRDVFHEELAWKSAKGLAILLASAVLAALLFALLAWSSRRIAESRWGRALLRPASVPLFALLSAALLALITWRLETRMPDTLPRRKATETAAQASNVLFIVVDTLRADHLKTYGYAKGRTPHLDRFSQDALRFEQAFANASWTRPSFASLLTGRLPSNHGVMAKSDALAAKLETLPERLRSAGWHTAGFVTNFNVAPYFNFHQGFDEYRYLEPDFVLGADDASAKLLLVQFLKQKVETWRALRGQVLPGTAYQDARKVNDEVLAWLGRAPSTPWFLFVGYMDPHDPYFRHPYEGKGYARAAHPHPKVEEAERLRALYDGEITFWDQNFGRLIESLKKRGLYDDMTIVITSDHGEEFADHGGFWHGTTLYDEQVRVPLFVKLPRNEKGGTSVAHWVQSIDLMPTLLRQFGLSLPKGVQGGDLFAGSEVVYSEESHEGNVLRALREKREGESLKAISANAGNPRGLPTFELFQVDRDPGERRDISQQDAEQSREARASLSEWESNASKGAIPRRQVSIDHDQAAVERLRALGYVGE